MTGAAWKVAWTAFIVAVFSWGVAFYGPSVFLLTLHAERGWPISIISLAITTHFLFSALLVLYLPEAHRRYGIAAITQAGVAFLMTGILAWATAREPWWLFPAALISGAGWAATSGAALNAMVAPWFDRDRPKAVGLAFNGASIGGLLFTPLWIWLIAQLGFPAATAIVAATMGLILWPVTWLILRPRPLQTNSTTPTVNRAGLLRDRRFLTMSAAFALGLFAQVGLFAHLLTRLAPELGPGGAAGAISLSTVCAVAGRTALGWMVGERDRRLAAALNFALQVGGTVLLTFAHGPIGLIAGCILFGLGVGNLTSLPPLIAQQEFAAADVGRVVAMITAINQAAFAFAPAALGVLRDLAGDYRAAFALAATFQLAAALIVLVGREKSER